MADWFDTVRQFNDTHALLFAPEPKLQSFAVGLGRGTVLAEDFFAPTYLRMHAAFLRGDTAAALTEQAWKLNASSTFGQFGGECAERVAYRWLAAGLEIGAPRPPVPHFDYGRLEELRGALIGIGLI